MDMAWSKSILVPAFASAIVLTACKSNTISSNQTTNNGGSDVIGPSGGTVSLADGTEVRIPPGALTKDTTISVTVAQPGDYPVLSSQYTDVGKVYAFQPHGQKFQSAVVIDLAYTAASISDLAVLQSEPNGEWQPVSGAQFTSDTAEITTGSFSFYTVASTAQAPDSGPTCSGRGPDNSAPTGTFTNGSGIIPASTGVCPSGLYCGAVDLSTLVDGYATSSTGMSGGSMGSCTVYFLNLFLAPYQHACGYLANGIDKIGAGLASIQIESTAPITTQGYTTSQVTAVAAGVPASTQPGACAVGGQGSVIPCASPTGPTAVTITAIDGTHVAGSFSFPQYGDAGTLSGTFDLPFCQLHAGLDPTFCCIQ